MFDSFRSNSAIASGKRSGKLKETMSRMKKTLMNKLLKLSSTFSRLAFLEIFRENIEKGKPGKVDLESREHKQPARKQTSDAHNEKKTSGSIADV